MWLEPKSRFPSFPYYLGAADRCSFRILRGIEYLKLVPKLFSESGFRDELSTGAESKLGAAYIFQLWMTTSKTKQPSKATAFRVPQWKNWLGPGKPQNRKVAWLGVSSDFRTTGQ